MPLAGSYATVAGGVAAGGSERDRHEVIGAIGVAPFRELPAALPDVPFVVETPGAKAEHARDIATLKGLRSR
jgi:deoxyribonuclease-4